MFEQDVYPGGILKPANRAKGLTVGDGLAGARPQGGTVIQPDANVAFAFVVSWVRRRNYHGDTLLLSAVFEQGGSMFVELDVQHARAHWSLLDRGNGHNAG